MSKADCRTRILYVDTGVSIAGGQISLIEILKCLDTARFTPVVCSPGGSRMRAVCMERGVTWLPIPFRSIHVSSQAGDRVSGDRVSGGLKDAFGSLYGVFHLARLIRKHKIDIVHANNFKAALIGGVASALAGRPMIFHDRIHITHGALGWFTALLAARIVVVSRAVAAKHGRYMTRKVNLVYDGIDVDKFTARGESGQTNRVCYVGRISEEKAILRLVDAAPLVLEHVPDARFVVAGEPFTPDDEAYLEKIRQRIDKFGLAARFEFPGYVDDVPELLQSISVFALPSRKEPLGLVVMEAMALRKPVVAFDTGGPQEIVTNGDDGVLVKPGDVAAFADAIAGLLKDPGTASRMGDKGRQTVVERFSSPIFVERIMQVYDEIAPPCAMRNCR
ncbi:MAG: glycosyltransferase family 4 protein [Candidatus Eisenbacteria bacterium]